MTPRDLDSICNIACSRSAVGRSSELHKNQSSLSLERLSTIKFVQKYESNCRSEAIASFCKDVLLFCLEDFSLSDSDLHQTNTNFSNFKSDTHWCHRWNTFLCVL